MHFAAEKGESVNLTRWRLKSIHSVYYKLVCNMPSTLYGGQKEGDRSSNDNISRLACRRGSRSVQRDDAVFEFGYESRTCRRS